MDKLCSKPSSWEIFMSIPIIRLYTPVLICPFHGRLWKLNVQTKVSFFLWIEVWGQILTIDNLQRQLNVVLDWCWGIQYSFPCTLLSYYRDVDYIIFTIWGLLGYAKICDDVELLASWLGKFRKQKCGHLEHDPSMPYAGYLAREKCSDL